MKTANTPENKARFTALYWGQKIVCIDAFKYEESGEEWKWNKGDIGEVDPLFIEYVEFFELTLKPLSQISDEDAIEVATIMQIFPEDVLDWLNGDSMHEDFQSPFTFQHAIDYLRSKGYALNWMDLSLDDLIDYGWIKLKNS